jgi:hypothetical protein
VRGLLESSKLLRCVTVVPVLPLTIHNVVVIAVAIVVVYVLKWGMLDLMVELRSPYIRTFPSRFLESRSCIFSVPVGKSDPPYCCLQFHSDDLA